MEITINPAHESARVLRALAAMLTTLADAEGAGQISQADRPDTGATKEAMTILFRPNRVSTGAGADTVLVQKDAPLDLAAAFGGAGNVAGLLGSVPSQPPALIGAGSPTTQIPTSEQDAGNPAPDLAAAFGGSPSGPNGAPLTPPVGMPPAPPSGAPTVGGNTQVETDLDGLPWNDKIHSSNKKKGADGRWMRRRNVTDDMRRTVEAQLRAAMSVGNVQAPPAAAPPPPVAIPTPIPLPQTTPSAAASDGAITLPMLLPRITAAMAAGHLTADTAAAIAMDLSGGKINSVAMLAIAPQLIPAFWGRLDQLGVA